MKPNLKITLLSVTAISLTGGIVFAATQQNPASLAYVNAEDINVENAIVAKGGTVPSSADTCRRLGYGEGTPASIAYVNECDLELYAAIEKIVSPYEVGDLLCGSAAYICDDLGSAWGMVIYVDPNPIDSGFNGIAMALEDRVSLSSTSGVPWAAADLITPTPIEVVGANLYDIYGGKDNQNAYCGTTGADCDAPFNPTTPTSAFNACTTYAEANFDDWYLPSTEELMLMFETAQQVTYAAGATAPFDDETSTNFFVQFTGVPYWSSSQNYGFGSLGSASSAPASQALFVVFTNGYQNFLYKNTALAVRCVRALPI